MNDTADPEIELATGLMERFVQRRDVMAVQHQDGGWRPAQRPFTRGELRKHLRGEQSLGHYCVDQQGMSRMFCFDIDLRKWCFGGEGLSGATTSIKIYGEEDSILIDPRAIWNGKPSHTPDDEKNNPFGAEFGGSDHPRAGAIREQLQAQMLIVAEGLAWRINDLGIKTAVLSSGGKGLHVYGFTGPQKANEIREVATAIMGLLGWAPSKGANFFMHRFGQFQNLEIEVFPKQDSMEGKEFGNLLALPLGINRRTGRPRQFLEMAAPDGVAPAVMRPEEVFAGFAPWNPQEVPSVRHDLYALPRSPKLSASESESEAPLLDTISVPNEPVPATSKVQPPAPAPPRKAKSKAAPEVSKDGTFNLFFEG